MVAEQKRTNYLIIAENFYLDDNKLKAIQFYNKALEFNGSKEDYIEILFNIALIYDELDMLHESLETYEKIINIDNTVSGAYYGIAMMEERLGNKHKALSYYLRAIQINEYYDRAYYYVANIYDEIGEKEKALEYYNKVIELVPDDYITYNNIGSLYEELGQYDKALENIKKSLGIKNDYYKALFNMGVVYYRLGNIDKSLEYYFRSIKTNNKHHYTFLNVSAIYIEEKRYPDAVGILTIGIEYNEDAYDLYYNRACCYSICNIEKKAIEDIKKALELNPSIIQWVKKDKDFYNLYENEEFKKIVEQY